MTTTEKITTVVAVVGCTLALWQYVEGRAERNGAQASEVSRLRVQVDRLESAVNSLQGNLAGLERWLVDSYQQRGE